MDVITSLFPIGRGRTVSPQESNAAILLVSSEFEKVYTSINKFNSSVNEDVEQISVHTASLKKKFQELKKVMIQVCTWFRYFGVLLCVLKILKPGNVSTDAAAKNAEIVKIQEKIRSLKAQGTTHSLTRLIINIALIRTSIVERMFLHSFFWGFFFFEYC